MTDVVRLSTSLYTTFSAFLPIGYMTQEYYVFIKKVIDSGPYLAVIVNPQVFSVMHWLSFCPVSPVDIVSLGYKKLGLSWLSCRSKQSFL